MMQFDWTFSIIVLIAVLQINSTFSEDVATIVSTAQSQVDQAEKQLINDQVTFNEGLKNAIASVKLTLDALKSNLNLKDVCATLGLIKCSLTRSSKARNFTTSDFKNQPLPACAEIEMMISKLEDDMINYLQTKGIVEGDTSFVVQQIDNLKLGYFINYIFFTNTTSETTVSTIATLDKLVHKNDLFASSLYSTATQIANVLYDLKVAKYGNCNNHTNVKKGTLNKTVSAKKTTIRTTIVATTTQSDENQD